MTLVGEACTTALDALTSDVKALAPTTSTKGPKTCSTAGTAKPLGKVFCVSTPGFRTVKRQVVMQQPPNAAITHCNVAMRPSAPWGLRLG